MVMLLKNPAAARPTSSTRIALLVLTPLMIKQFLSVSFTIGVAPVETSAITLGVVALLFVIVRLRSVPPLFEPSMVVKLDLTTTSAPLATEPVSAAVTPVAGLIVIVFVAFDPRLALITIGNTSPVLSGEVGKFSVVWLFASSRGSTT